MNWYLEDHDMNIQESADRYVAKYGFMAANATMRDAESFHRVHADWMLEELKKIREELLQRGYQIIATEEEYKAQVAIHGLPPAFQPTEGER